LIAPLTAVVVHALTLLLQVGPAQALPEILVEQRLAAELGATVGDTVLVRPLASDATPRPFLIAGIHQRPADPNRIARNELEAVFHLPDLEALLGLDDRVDRFALALRPVSDPRAAGAWIEGLAFGTQAIPTADLARQASTTFEVVSRFHDAIGIITMFASSIFLLCLMVIRVDERRAQVRTMGLIGISSTASRWASVSRACRWTWPR
jgi:putative ABC transport system permease protein